MNVSLPRDPEQDARTRRFMQQLQVILNALLRNDEIEQDALNSFTIVSTAAQFHFAQIYGTPKGGYGMYGG